MRKFLLLIVICSLALGGCGDVDWFPEQGATQGVKQFSFSAQQDVPPGEPVTSNTITVETTNPDEDISVAGGEYSVNGNEFTSLIGVVVAGDQVRVRHIASSEGGGTVTTKLTIGDKSAEFKSTAGVRLLFDDPLILSATPDTEYTSSSETVEISGDRATVSITGGTFSIGDGPFVTSGEVRDGQTVRVRQRSAAAGATGAAATNVATLTIGNMKSFFTTSITPSATQDVEVSGTTGTEELMQVPSLVTGDFTLGVGPSTGTATVSLDDVDRWDIPPRAVSLRAGQTIFIRENIFPSTAEIRISSGNTIVQRINIDAKAQ